ncbi:hypothetical protein PSTG_11118 [Puccinia striiformis f. sp. tritici PST-78]|uniref:Uncharacterized protein n=1 Tax=Puccinia striiformis f. sp. tritici PST-78 TaxID=1165861 RepID=A0A0L0V8A9_9BASI|nr:hypothetical protein PSTG_11118 [Puccinia striiformis f. sp. tritici PST-78]
MDYGLGIMDHGLGIVDYGLYDIQLTHLKCHFTHLKYYLTHLKCHLTHLKCHLMSSHPSQMSSHPSQRPSHPSLVSSHPSQQVLWFQMEGAAGFIFRLEWEDPMAKTLQNCHPFPRSSHTGIQPSCGIQKITLVLLECALFDTGQYCVKRPKSGIDGTLEDFLSPGFINLDGPAKLCLLGIPQG